MKNKVNILVLQEIGAKLKHIRIDRGASILDISNATRVKKHFIEAIEEADIEVLKNITYTVGYIKLYAAVFDVDVTALLCKISSQYVEIQPIGSEILINNKDFMAPKWLVIACILCGILLYKFGVKK